MGTGLGALLTKVALAGQIRKLRDEITDGLKAFNKASEEDDVKQPSDIAHAASDR